MLSNRKKKKPDMNRSHLIVLLSTCFAPNYAQHVAKKNKKLLDAIYFHALPCNPYVKPYVVFKGHLVKCVALIDCNAI